MIDMLIEDLEKEMTQAELEEKDGQEDYEQFMKDFLFFVLHLL